MGKWESNIVADGMRRLKTYPDVKAIKIHGSAFQEKGNPDIIGSSHGRSVVVEVKNEEGQLSKIQVGRLTEWWRSGAVCCAARSADEIVRAFLYHEANWSPDEEDLRPLPH